MRWKPLYLQVPTVGNDGERGVIRSWLMFAAGGRDIWPAFPSSDYSTSSVPDDAPSPFAADS